MDKDDRPERKVRFPPRGSKRKPNRGTTTRSEAINSSAQAAKTSEIPHRFNLGTRRSKDEKTFSEHVSFGHEAPTDSIRTYGVTTSGSSGKSSGSEKEDTISGDKHIPIILPDETIVSSENVVDSPSNLKIEGYREPWDYNSNYPTTLPFGQPCPGDPELLDNVEFVDDLEEYDENRENTALELGLLEVSEKKELFLLQLPSTLPLVKQPSSAKGNVEMGASLNGCEIKDLPRGFVGKMLVYKSGKVKLRVGDTLLDVNPGVEVSFPRHAVAINTKEKHCCVLGDIHKSKIVVTPDIDSFSGFRG